MRQTKRLQTQDKALEYCQHIMDTKGLTWQGFIKEKNFDRTTITNWLSNHRYPSRASFQEICDYIGIDIQDIEGLSTRNMFSRSAYNNTEEIEPTLLTPFKKLITKPYIQRKGFDSVKESRLNNFLFNHEHISKEEIQSIMEETNQVIKIIETARSYTNIRTVSQIHKDKRLRFFSIFEQKLGHPFCLRASRPVKKQKKKDGGYRTFHSTLKDEEIKPVKKILSKIERDLKKLVS